MNKCLGVMKGYGGFLFHHDLDTSVADFDDGDIAGLEVGEDVGLVVLDSCWPETL